MSSYLMDGYYGDNTAASAATSERVGFIRRTYAHLVGAILIFAGIEALLLNAGVGLQLMDVFRAHRFAWIGLMIMFIAGGYLAQYMARNTASVGSQYLGLGLYIAIEVVIFLPILTICTMIPRFQAIPLQAGLLTLIVFGGLSAVVFISKKDFSFLGFGITVVSWLALGVVIVGAFTGFGLGIWFSAAMIALASACILYTTSNVLHYYPVNAHVAAALELFAAIALLFYYVVRIMMSFAAANE